MPRSAQPALLIWRLPGSHQHCPRSLERTGRPPAVAALAAPAAGQPGSFSPRLTAPQHLPRWPPCAAPHGAWAASCGPAACAPCSGKVRRGNIGPRSARCAAAAAAAPVSCPGALFMAAAAAAGGDTPGCNFCRLPPPPLERPRSSGLTRSAAQPSGPLCVPLSCLPALPAQPGDHHPPSGKTSAQPARVRLRPPPASMPTAAPRAPRSHAAARTTPALAAAFAAAAEPALKPIMENVSGRSCCLFLHCCS